MLPPGVDLDRLILIVTGAHLRAEVGDRPLAYRLRERIVGWLDERLDADGDDPRRLSRVVVCSDVWYLNNDELRRCPAISIGGPGVNALSAYLGDKLPSAFVIDDVLVVQLDPGFDELLACVWGVNHAATVTAVDAFAERYLGAFLEAATRAWED